MITAPPTWETLRTLNVGKEFARRLASIKNVGEDKSKVGLSRYTQIHLGSLIPGLLCKDRFASFSPFSLTPNTNLYEPYSLLGLSPHVFSAKGLPEDTNDMLVNFNRYEADACTTQAITVRAAQSKTFWGVKVTRKYPEYNSWKSRLSIAFQVARVIQFSKLARIEDMLLNTAYKSSGAYSLPVYASELLAALDMVYIPALHAKRTKNNLILWRDLAPVVLQDLRQDIADTELSQLSRAHWMFDVLQDIITEASNGVADFVAEDIEPVSRYLNNIKKSKPSASLRNVSTSYRTKSSKKTVRTVNNFFAPDFMRYTTRESLLLNLASFLSFSGSKNECKLPMVDENHGSVPESATLGISIGLKVDDTSVQPSGEFVSIFPTIRLELKRKNSKSSAIVALPMPGKYISLRTVL